MNRESVYPLTLAQADAENRPMYLEASTKRNSEYYARFGFKVERPVVFDNSPEPITMYIMVREPQAPRQSCGPAVMAAVKF